MRLISAVDSASLYNETFDEKFTDIFVVQDARNRMTLLKIDPKWNNLRREPRFIELMRRMNFK